LILLYIYLHGSIGLPENLNVNQVQKNNNGEINESSRLSAN
jgi:hypothetical protein